MPDRILLERLAEELADLTPEELGMAVRLIDALKRTRESPLAFIEESMQFQYAGKEGSAILHRMVVSHELMNRYHILHGGVTATFLDTALGHSVNMSQPNARFVTQELSIHFLRPGVEGTLTCRTEIIHSGKNTVVAEAKVFDEKGRTVAAATGIFFRFASPENE